MRVLLYSDTPQMAGAGQVNHMIACGLKRKGIDLWVAQAWADHALVQEQARLGIPHIWLQPDNIYSDPLRARAFTDFTEPTSVFSTVAPNLVLFADGAVASNLTARQTAIKQEIPFVSLVHLVSQQSLAQFSTHLAEVCAAYRAARQVVAVSQHNLALLRRCCDLPSDKGRVILNARPDVYFATPSLATCQMTRSELNLPSDAVVCLTTARVELEKGCHYVVEAARQLSKRALWPRLFFVWAGEGTRLEQMRALARLLRVDDHVRFVGQRSDILSLLDAADIFLLPSQAEGMPLAVIEAMAKGLPVMATAVGGTPEAVGDCGCLLPNPNEDKAAMLNALIVTVEGWADDPTLRQSLGRAAHHRAAALFREERMVGDYLSLLHSGGFYRTAS
jgi:glycosyltransferase involved in cell wall biosynthesis